MFEINFVRYPASITYLCHTYLITTFKILYREYRLIYRISEFSYSLVSVTAPAPKITYCSGPTIDSPDYKDKVLQGYAYFFLQTQSYTLNKSLSWNINPKRHSPEFWYPPSIQQTLIQPQVSYLTTLNNVYISETDNKRTPNTESGFIPTSPVSTTGPSHRAEQAWTPPH